MHVRSRYQDLARDEMQPVVDCLKQSCPTGPNLENDVYTSFRMYCLVSSSRISKSLIKARDRWPACTTEP